jgi:hypothetical protein
VVEEERLAGYTRLEGSSPKGDLTDSGCVFVAGRKPYSFRFGHDIFFVLIYKWVEQSMLN